MVPAIAVVSFLVGIVIYGSVSHPESLHQPGITIAATVFVIFWGSLLCYGLINLIFNKIVVNSYGKVFNIVFATLKKSCNRKANIS